MFLLTNRVTVADLTTFSHVGALFPVPCLGVGLKRSLLEEHVVLLNPAQMGYRGSSAHPLFELSSLERRGNIFGG